MFQQNLKINPWIIAAVLVAALAVVFYTLLASQYVIVERCGSACQSIIGIVKP